MFASAEERRDGLDIILRTLIAATGYTENESSAMIGGTDPLSSPRAVRARAAIREMAVDFDRLRDVILPLGVDPETKAWTFDLVHAEFRFSEESSPASIAKYNLSDDQKATFMNGILDLCNFVCNPAGAKQAPNENSITDDLEAGNFEINVPDAVTTADEVHTLTTSDASSLPEDTDLMEGIERIRVGSKLRDLHGLFEQELLFEATRDVQKKMTEMMAQRADDVSEDKDKLLDMQKKFHKTKEKATADLEDAKAKVEGQEKASTEFGVRMEKVFEERDAKHDEQISLLQLSDAAADYMLAQQENMLNGKQCFCLIVDRRQTRRTLYCFISTIMIILVVYTFRSV